MSYGVETNQNRRGSLQRISTFVSELINFRASMLGLLLLCTFILLQANWRGPLYSFDDGRHMRLSLGARFEDWALPLNGYYNPTATLSWFLDLALFGDGRTPVDGKRAEPCRIASDGRVLVSPTLPGPFSFAVPPAYGMRLMNGLYHTLAALFLWLFLRYVTGAEAGATGAAAGATGASKGVAALVALAWAVHPMACETVCWVSERKNTLVALFGFGMLWAWAAGRQGSGFGVQGSRAVESSPGATAGEPNAATIQNPKSKIQNHRWWRWPLVSVLYALAQLSKASAPGLLLVLVMLEILDPGRSVTPPQPRRWLRSVAGLAMPLAVGIAGIMASRVAFDADIVPPPGGSVWTALLTDVEILCRYARHVLLPVDLSFFNGVQPIVSLLDGRLWVYGGLLAGMCLGLIYLAGTQRRLALLGVLWFFAALGPNSNVISCAFWMQDRYAYLAVPGLLLAVGVAGFEMAKRAPVLRTVLCIWLAGLAVLAAQRSALFGHCDRLLLDAANRQPLSGIARLSAGYVLKDRYYAFLSAGARTEADATLRTLNALYTDMELCPDIDRHTWPITVRVRKAEVLLLMGRVAEAREALGPLPPPDVPAVPGGQRLVWKIAMDDAHNFQQPLARAWTLTCQMDLQHAEAATAPAPERIAAAQSAIQAAEKSREALNADFTADLLQGKALLLLAQLQRAHDPAGAQKARAEAVAVLSGIPPTSAMAPRARTLLLDAQKPPEP
ncbi:MAG TPA: hypothetical protein VGP72_07110 [Planctomycetota bacterium]|jgi:hypothetical protein